MPQFDFRGIIAAPFELNNGTPSYGDIFAVGDAMNCTLELRFAEGRLYAESTLAEYMRKATGGTVSIGVKYIPYGAQEKCTARSPRQRRLQTVTPFPSFVTPPTALQSMSASRSTRPT